MHRYSPTNPPNLLKTASSLLMSNASNHARETAFDPLNYEFDTETMTEPFSYFHNGPTESRRKMTEYPSATYTHLSWLPTHTNSILSSPDESPQSHYSPILNEQFSGLIRSKIQQSLHQPIQPLQSSYPKTICRHCKSHNMPECLYTSHNMYDENGAIFCPVLKKCHCATCLRVTNSNPIRDDDSDDDINIRLPTLSNDFNHFYGIQTRANSYRMNNNNNF